MAVREAPSQELSERDADGVRIVSRSGELEVLASAGRVVVVPPADGPVARAFALAGATELLPPRATTTEAVAALGPVNRG